MIRDGYWKAKINEINMLPEGSKEQEQMKRTLTGIIWQGTFKKRENNGLIEHSGLIACDFDKIPDDKWNEYRDILMSCPHVYALFRSPRRKGLKAIFRIPKCDQDTHRYYARGLRYYFEGYSCYDHYEDVARLCYASHDPDIYFNPDATEFTQLIVPETTSERPVISGTSVSHKEFFDIISGWVRYKKHSAYTNLNKHKYIVAILMGCNRAGIPRDIACEMTYVHCMALTTDKVDKVPKGDFEYRAQNVYKLYADQFGSRPMVRSVAPVTIIEPELVVTQPVSKVSFPVDVLPMDLVLYIDELNASLNYSKDFLAISAMWTLATVNGNKYKLKVKNGWVAPTIFWFAVVGEPGTMKSHPIDIMITPIKQIDRERKIAFDHEYDEWEAQDQQYTKTRNPNRKPQFMQTLMSDFTLESLHVVHNINRRGIGLFKDELIAFLNDMNRYRKGSDEQFWLESFNNKSYVVNRIRSDKPLMINDTMINILGGIQPAVLTKVTKEYAGNGMIDRFLFTTNETGIYPISINDINPDWMVWWESQIKAFNQSIYYTDSEDTEILSMTTEAMQMFIQIDNDFCTIQRSDQETAALKNYISKMKTYLPRFALLMCLFDMHFEQGFLTVTSDHMERAKRICDYFIHIARYVFDDSDKRQEIDSIVISMKSSTKKEKVIALAQKGFTSPEICRALNMARSNVHPILKSAGLIPEKQML